MCLHQLACVLRARRRPQREGFSALLLEFGATAERPRSRARPTASTMAVSAEDVIKAFEKAKAASADAEGNTVPASHYGMPDDAPSETLLTVLFADLGDGATRVTVRQEGWDDDAMASGAGAGWEQAFHKMAATLAAL